MTGLRVAGLGVAYGDVTALRDVSFAVPAGGSLAVAGPSGAGKTSLLWALAGAVPFAGVAELDGAPVAGRGDVALVPQGNGLPSFLTAAENVVVPLLAAGLPGPEARSRGEAALALLGLEQFGTHLVEELSGGQQQRVAVARALAARPRLLLADEPTSDLDAANRERVIDALRAETARGATVIMTTHDPDAAARLDAVLHL